VEKAAGCLSDTQRARGSQKGELVALRIGELRLCVGGLVVSGSVTRRRKRYGSGGDEKFEIKLDEIRKDIARESLFLPVGRTEGGIGVY